MLQLTERRICPQFRPHRPAPFAVPIGVRLLIHDGFSEIWTCLRLIVRQACPVFRVSGHASLQRAAFAGAAERHERESAFRSGFPSAFFRSGVRSERFFRRKVSLLLCCGQNAFSNALRPVEKARPRRSPVFPPSKAFASRKENVLFGNKKRGRTLSSPSPPSAVEARITSSCPCCNA